MLEPGRSLVGNAGILLTTVQFLKHNEARNFAVVDAAMNDLLRPTLYQAYHGVRAVVPRHAEARVYDVVGPVCESGDWLAKERSLAIEQDDVLALESAGAYGMVMAGNYNTRPRAAEVMVDGEQYHIVRQRDPSRTCSGANPPCPEHRGQTAGKAPFAGLCHLRLQLAVGVQSRQEHIHAQEGKAGDQQAHQRPIGRHGPAQALHQAHMQPGGVVQPHDEGPGLLGIPLPIGAPGVGRPQRPSTVATVKKAKPIAMARYMMSSSTSSAGSACAIRRRASRMAPTITTLTPP